MDQDRLQGAARTVGGRIEEKAGEYLGDAKTQMQGRIDEAAGKLQNSYGAMVEDIEEFTERLRDRVTDQPLVSILLAAAVGYLIGRVGRWI